MTRPMTRFSAPDERVTVLAVLYARGLGDRANSTVSRTAPALMTGK